MREIVHLQAGQCGNQIGAKVSDNMCHFRTLLSCIIYDQRVLCTRSLCIVLVTSQKPHPRNINVSYLNVG